MKIFLLKFLKGEINPLINFLIFLITFIIFIGILSLLFQLYIADQKSLRLIFNLYGIYSLLSVYISLKSIFITDLAKVLANSYDRDVELEYVGIRPGEKIHEEMVSLEESLRSIESKKYFMITDDVINNDVWSFSSDTTVIPFDEIKDFLIKKGVIK